MTVVTHGCPVQFDYPAAVALEGRVLAGPSGLGTSSARVAGLDLYPAYAEMPWGDGTAPPLYCPVVQRVNEPLADEVNRRLVIWAGDCGFSEDEVKLLGAAGFGRLVMLTHADCEDPDLLLVAAQLNAAWWAADDLYARSGCGIHLHSRERPHSCQGTPPVPRVTRSGSDLERSRVRAA